MNIPALHKNESNLVKRMSHNIILQIKKKRYLEEGYKTNAMGQEKKARDTTSIEDIEFPILCKVYKIKRTE